MSAALQGARRTASYVRMATKIDAQRRAQYRGSMWVWSLGSVLQVCVGLAVWRVVARTAGSIGGYGPGAMVGYFLVLLVIREATYSGVPWWVEEQVIDGTFTAQLVRPVHPMLTAYASASAFRYISFVLIAPATVALYFIFHATIGRGWLSMLLAAALIPFANVARMYADSIVASGSLWVVKIAGYRQTYYLVMLFLGGQFAPISVLPHGAQLVARALPFYWFLGFPVELAVGRQPLSHAWIGFVVLTGWGVALHLALRVIWRRGLRAHESVGQ